MTFSKETLDATLNNLTTDDAVRWIGLAGSASELNRLIAGLTRNFNTVVPPKAAAAIREASSRWWTVNRHPHVSYRVS